MQVGDERSYEEQIEELLQQVGPVGTHSGGHLTEDDAGDLRIGIAMIGNKVVVAPGTATKWFALDVETAATIAASILNHACTIDAGTATAAFNAAIKAKAG